MLDRSISGAFPKLHKLTVAGIVILNPASPWSNWSNLRNVAECPFPSVQELTIRLTLLARPEVTLRDPSTPVLDSDIRPLLQVLDWALFDAILNTYRGRNLGLEIRLRQTSFALSTSQLPHTVRLVEDIVRGCLSAHARGNIRLCVR